MNKTMSVAALSIILGCVGLSEEASISGSLSVDFVSQYVGFCNGAVFYDKPMFQTDLYLQHKSGLHADIWWGTGLNSDLRSSGFDDEVDWNVGFANSFEIGNRKIAYDFGVGYWDIYSLFTSTRNDLVHPFAEVAVPFDLFTNVMVAPFLKWEGYFLPFETDFEGGGTITSIGAKYNWGIAPDWAITGCTSFGYDDGGFGFQEGVIWKDYINLEWNISRHLTWKMLEFQVYVPLNVSDREVEKVFGTGLVWKF